MNETERMNRQIKLKDGRMLGYAEYGEYGAAERKPVFCFHGFPGSQIVADSDGSRSERRSGSLRDADAGDGLQTGPKLNGRSAGTRNAVNRELARSVPVRDWRR
jgi:hypothetical protein